MIIWDLIDLNEFLLGNEAILSTASLSKSYFTVPGALVSEHGQGNFCLPERKSALS
jgi:hypothetical protein